MAPAAAELPSSLGSNYMSALHDKQDFCSTLRTHCAWDSAIPGLRGRGTSHVQHRDRGLLSYLILRTQEQLSWTSTLQASGGRPLVGTLQLYTARAFILKSTLGATEEGDVTRA